MSKLYYPDRIFSLSDCHGGQSAWNPLKSPDIGARLAEAIRSDLPGLQHFDTYGVPARYHDYVVHEALRLHRENPDADITGLFINSAPRTKAHVNGEPFFRAEFDEKIVIAGTPLSTLSAVRDSVRKLFVCPNEGNGRFDPDKEQNRSSHTVRLLADNPGLNFEEVDPSIIPELSHGRILRNVDRFGNLVIHENLPQGVESLQARIAESIGETLRLKIGKYACDVQVGRSLSETDPGSLVVYVNDGSIEILRKWAEGWNLQQKFRKNAWSSFGKPQIGAGCEVQVVSQNWRKSIADVFTSRRGVVST